jgi:Brp/Blh family beta-carotene 15,15'-monooxygenase
MVKLIMLLMGAAMVLLQNFAALTGPEAQFAMFIAGVLILGIPHGAADLLVAMRNESDEGRRFSYFSFFSGYLGRLSLFALLLWVFPVAGLLIFIAIAAFHFGETDLARFRTEEWYGRLLAGTYGMLLLGVMLLCHLDEVRPFLALLDDSPAMNKSLDVLEGIRWQLLASLSAAFLLSVWVYLRKTGQHIRTFGIRTPLSFLGILLIVYQLPLILGFTFYFVTWHSVISISRIIGYLCSHNGVGVWKVISQIAFYSMIAILGIVAAGWAGFMFADQTSIMWYSFMGLAVLTAPHMEVMHEMYQRLRASH